MLSETHGRTSMKTDPTARTRQSGSAGSRVRRAVARTPAPHPTVARPRAAVTLFEVSFATATSNGELALLARALDLTTRSRPKLSPPHDSPGLARLDHDSGLFLRRGVLEGEWMLEARTWGHPPAQCIHDWHVLAAVAAHQVDPAVTLPERLTHDSPEIRDRPVGRAANKRLARLRRRLVGLA